MHGVCSSEETQNGAPADIGFSFFYVQQTWSLSQHIQPRLVGPLTLTAASVKQVVPSGV